MKLWKKNKENSNENHHAFFKRDIFMEKEKEKVFYYSNNNFFTRTHIYIYIHFWVANILESSECFSKCKNNIGIYFRTKHEDPLNSTDIRVIFAMRDEYIWTVPSVSHDASELLKSLLLSWNLALWSDFRVIPTYSLQKMV